MPASEFPQTLAIVYNTSRYLYRFRRELITALQDTGLQIVALAPDREYASELARLNVRLANIQLRSHSMSLFSDVATYREIKEKLEVYSPEIVFNFTIKPNIYGSLAAHRNGVREIYSMVPGLGYLFTERNAINTLVRILVLNLYRVALRYNRKVFFQNPTDYEFFLRKKIISRKQGIVLNGSGIDLETYISSDRPDPFPTFFMATRLLKHKGVAEFIEAAKILNANGPVARFVLAGPLDKSPAAVPRDLICRSVEEGHVEYVGELEDVRPWISKSWAVVLPSYYREGTPRILLEALGMGRPVITTDLPGCRDVVIDGENGYLVPPSDAGSLVTAMRHLLENETQVQRMSEVSRRIAEEKYDVRIITRQILSAMGRQQASVVASRGVRDGGRVTI